MEITTDKASTMCATRSNLATALSDPERVLHRATVDMGEKPLSLETKLREPAVTKNYGTVQLFMERLMPALTVMRDNEEMAGTILEKDSDVIFLKAAATVKVRFKPLSDIRSKMERALADLGVAAKADL